MVTEYKDRLEQAMKDAEVSTAELASALNVSYQAVRKVLLGGQFGMDNNAKAAKRLGVRSDWLATGRGPKKIEEAALASSDWPFSGELLQKCLSLSADGLYRLETVMRAHLGMSAPSQTRGILQMEERATPHVTAERFSALEAEKVKGVSPPRPLKSETSLVEGSALATVVGRFEGKKKSASSKSGAVPKSRVGRRL